MEIPDFINYYKNQESDEPSFSKPAATIKTMMYFIDNDDSITFQGFFVELYACLNALRESKPNSTSIRSTAEIFMRFITKTYLEQPDFNECKKILLTRGKLFLDRLLQAQLKIAEVGKIVIENNMKILVNTSCRTVFSILEAAKKQGKNLFVYILKGHDNRGVHMLRWLKSIDIRGKIIDECQMAYYVDLSDIVLAGIEVVTECGGFIAPIGTYPLALCAKEARKDLYLCSESVKFITEVLPFYQTDVPIYLKLSVPEELGTYSPKLDFTSSRLISYYITDLGIQKNLMVYEQFLSLYV